MLYCCTLSTLMCPNIERKSFVSPSLNLQWSLPPVHPSIFNSKVASSFHPLRDASTDALWSRPLKTLINVLHRKWGPGQMAHHHGHRCRCHVSVCVMVHMSYVHAKTSRQYCAYFTVMDGDALLFFWMDEGMIEYVELNASTDVWMYVWIIAFCLFDWTWL